MTHNEQLIIIGGVIALAFYLAFSAAKNAARRVGGAVNQATQNVINSLPPVQMYNAASTALDAIRADYESSAAGYSDTTDFGLYGGFGTF